MTAMPPVALLAGGLATRMRPLTENVPKSMLIVAGAPFVSHQLRLLRREGIERVVLCVGHLWESIADFVGNGSKFGLQVEYSTEYGHLLGTGGALKRALPLLGEEFLVHYGDSYLDIPFAPIVDAFRASRRLGLMTVYRNENEYDLSNIEFNGHNILNYSKQQRTSTMNYIDWGLSVLRSESMSYQAEKEAFDLSALYGSLVGDGQMAAFEVHSRFYEIGSADGLKDADEYLRSRTCYRLA